MRAASGRLRLPVGVVWHPKLALPCLDRHPLLFQLLAHVLCEAWQVGVVVPVGGFTERLHDANSLPAMAG
jgi:hypothetical protein